MLKNILKIFGVSCGYAAAIIGAGFASGQEIVSFFVRYGRYSIIGIFIACAIFFLFSCSVLCVCARTCIYSYSDLLDSLFNNERVCCAIKLMTLVFAIASVCVMTACAGEMGEVIADVPRICGAALFTVLCGIIFFMGNRKIMKINSVLGAVIVLGIIFTCLYILRFREHQTSAYAAPIVMSGAAYAGYNLLTAGSVLANMSRNISGRGEAVLCSAASGLILFVMITLIWGVLGIYYGKINLGEIPMLTMALRQNWVFGAFYSVMLFFAVLTTGVSNGFVVIDIIDVKMGRAFAVFMLLMLSFCMSGAGFSNLINTVYRICGYIGAALVFTLIIAFFSASKNIKMERIEENRSISKKTVQK